MHRCIVLFFKLDIKQEIFGNENEPEISVLFSLSDFSENKQCMIRIVCRLYSCLFFVAFGLATENQSGFQ